MTILHSRPRPRRVTYLALGVLTIAGLSAVRFALAIKQWKFLDSLPGVSPVYIMSTGLVWILTAGPLAWGLWRGHSWAPRTCQTAALAYSAYIWIERLFLFDRTPGSWIHFPDNAPFILVVNLLLLLFTFWSTTGPKPDLFFGATHE
jgi:H+/Cl- antiporter ClcA